MRPKGFVSESNPPAEDGFRFAEVDRHRWRDLVRLFEAPGGPKFCWCMAWRPLKDRSKPAGGARRRAALQRRVRAGVPVGLLAYQGEEPVAWCSVAPRSTFRPLGGLDGPDEGVWSVVCFFVPRRLRRSGLMRRLLAAAIDTARRHGATVLEAYPVDASSPSYRFMGYVPAFRAAGFRTVGRAGTRRHVMRLDLARSPKTVR
jgi:GNAT superfamily N-acetyltransferase